MLFYLTFFFILRVRFSVFSYVQEPFFFFHFCKLLRAFKNLSVGLLLTVVEGPFILAILAIWNMCVYCFVFTIFFLFFFVFWLYHVETCVLYILNYQFISLRNFLVVQCLGLCTSNTGGMSSVPGWEAKIPHAAPSAPLPPKFISLSFYDFWILHQT